MPLEPQAESHFVIASASACPPCMLMRRNQTISRTRFCHCKCKRLSSLYVEAKEPNYITYEDLVNCGQGACQELQVASNAIAVASLTVHTSVFLVWFLTTGGTVLSMLIDAAAFWRYDNRESLMIDSDSSSLHVSSSTLSCEATNLPEPATPPKLQEVNKQSTNRT
eukprot:1207825-Amphidinium_carterae.1